MTWHPIDTAPKDGSFVIGRVRGKWTSQWVMWWVHNLDGGWCINDGPMVPEQPTHWAKLEEGDYALQD